MLPCAARSWAGPRRCETRLMSGAGRIISISKARTCGLLAILAGLAIGAMLRLTTPGCPSTRVGVLDHIAFRYLYSVGTRDIPIAAQWLAYAIPCRRFTVGLAATDARLGDDADR
jgi:hypothetical protein